MIDAVGKWDCAVINLSWLLFLVEILCRIMIEKSVFLFLCGYCAGIFIRSKGLGDRCVDTKQQYCCRIIIIFFSKVS